MKTCGSKGKINCTTQHIEKTHGLFPTRFELDKEERKEQKNTTDNHRHKTLEYFLCSFSLSSHPRKCSIGFF